MEYELIDHTADFGFRFNSPELSDLFADGAVILSELLIDIGPRKPEIMPMSLSVDGDGSDYVDLMVKWLGEILYLFDCEHIAMKEVDITSLSPTNIKANALIFEVDIDNDEFVHALKAVTYHQAKVEKVQDIWTAQVICDT